jgi:hypothetical protein
MRAPLATAFAISFGLIVLIGYLVPVGSAGWILDLRNWIVNLAVTLAAFAALVAILGLLGTHWRKLRARRNPDRYSILVLIGFAATFLYGVYAYGAGSPADQSGFQNLVNGIQIPIETSLMAAVAIVLTLACFRLLQRRRGLLPIVFVISVLAFLLLNSGLLASRDDPLLGTFLSALQFLPVAGGRGILLGIALGSLMAGLRILFGVERPYSG